jgi:iron(III) transport system substrate-binding protein
VFLLSRGLVGAQSQEVIDAAKKEGKVSIFGTLDKKTARKVQDIFEKKYPEIKTSYWRGSGTAVLKKSMSEHRADKVTWDILLASTDPMEIVRKDGMFTKYQSPMGSYFDEQYHHPYFSPSYRRVIVGWLYNTKAIKPEDAPKNYWDVLDPKWKGKITIGHPAGHTFTAQTLSSLHLVLGSKEKEDEYIEKLAAQKPGKLKSMGPASRAVASGEFPIALTFIKYVDILGRDGAPLDYVRLPGYLGDQHYLGISKKVPHPNAAKLWIDYWYSKDVMEVIAQSGEFVNMPGIYPPLKGADKIKFVQAVSRNKKDYKKLKKKYGKIFGK